MKNSSRILATICGIRLGFSFSFVPPAAQAGAITVDTVDDLVDGDISSIANLIATPGADLILFDSSTNGSPFTLTGASGENANVSGDLDIIGSDDLTITGNGIASTITQAGATTTNGIDRVFDIIFNAGSDVTFENLTIRHGRIFGPDGGGIYARAITLNFATITLNIADDDNNASGDGGGIFSSSGTINSQNSIIQNNDDKSTPTAGDCGGTGVYNSLGGNVVGVGAGCPATGPDDIATADAMLGPLQNNGGATATHALLAGSPAINITANGLRDCGTTITTDQIGNPRPFDGACDAGAFEFGVKAFVFVANKVTLKSTKQVPSHGDIHSNGLLTVEKGKPSTYNSTLTAVGKITINKQNTINGTPSGGSLSLAPDSYGIVTMSNNGTLKLTSGEYFMNELRYSSSIEGGVIEIDLSSGAPVKINIVTNFQFGHEGAIRLLPNGEDDSELVTFNTKQTTAANWGREAYLLGSFNAPSAIVTLVKNTQLRGAICAKEILVSNDCLFLHHESSGSLPGPGNLPKSFGDDEADSYQLSAISYQLIAMRWSRIIRIRSIRARRSALPCRKRVK